MQTSNGYELFASYREECADGVTIFCFDTIPQFIGKELDGLYQHLNCSLSHHVVRQRARDSKVYVARRGSVPLAIFLFHHQRRSIHVLNEMIRIAPEELERFARFSFGSLPEAQVISFSLIEKDVGTVSLPHQQHGHSEDIVISLPKTPDEYFSRLGSKMRHNIKCNLKALSRDHSGLCFRTFETEMIDPRHIRDLIELKRSNIEKKNMAFGMTPEEVTWLVEHAHVAGLMTVALLEGRLCGGCLSFRLGNHYFMHVSAYEAAFAKYSLGILCSYLSIREKIMRGATEDHLSWGRNRYKFKLLGVQRDMSNLDIYRSRTDYFRHAHTVIRNALSTRMVQFKIRLLDSEDREDAWFARSCVGIARIAKRSAFALTRRHPQA